MSAIRPLERGDLPAFARLYAELARWSLDRPMPGYVDFFARTLLDQPFADPEIPSLVYEAPERGVVGVIGSHVRPYVHEGRSLRLACCGPLIVHPDHRARGVGALLLRRYLAGPQDLTFNDRVSHDVRPMWMRLGAVLDTGASVGWARSLRPAGYVSDPLTVRMRGRRTPLGGAVLSRIGPRLVSPPAAGRTDPLGGADLLELIDGLAGDAVLRPAYDEAFLAWLFETMERVELGDRLLRRLVRNDDGRPVGAFLAYAQPLGAADVIQVFGTERNLGLVIDHLLYDVAAAGAVKVRGRGEPALLPPLLDRGCRLGAGDWVAIHSGDPLLVNAVLSGKALVSRMDGEWWMRPHADRA